MSSPLISKVRCHSPNSKSSGKVNGSRRYDSRIRNKALLIYIATRDGVDLSIEEKDLEKYLESDLENLDSSQSNLNYEHGLFGNISVPNLYSLADDLYRKTNDGKCIYNGIVSITEEDAKELGYLDRQKWEQYMFKVMPDIAAKLKIPIHELEWVAAIHKEKGHPHVHYMLWNNTNKVRSPFIHVNVQKEIRKILTKEMFQERQQDYTIQKNLARDYLTEFGKTTFKDVKEYIKGEKEEFQKLKNFEP
ncbi:MAG: relaxase MobL, partial [Bacteroidales bacterium]|nr:relaxase MobL [Bacteroidales bacterium]